LAGRVGFRSSQVSKIGVTVFGNHSGKVELGLFGGLIGKVTVSAGSTCQVSARQGFLFGQTGLSRVGFRKVQFVLFFGNGVPPFRFGQFGVLPKSEFVVKCCQDSRGSGSKARCLAQPENA